jgi:hypothetical protein
MDDGNFFYLGRNPHPANLAVSWGKCLSQALKNSFHCGAESASSNQRILRTTREWIKQPRNQDALVIIQWSTWEREEWQNEDGAYFQVNASGIDDVPDSMKLRYKDFVANIDWHVCTQKWHDTIWKFHQELEEQGISHIFFNGNNDFSTILDQYDWGTSYIGPYNSKSTYDAILKQNNYQTVAPNSWHFGQEAHSFWANYMLQYIVRNQLM